jgi:hypothetical protein
MESNKASARLSPSSEKTTDLALLGRVGNQALVVQPVQCIPIEGLPGAMIIVKAEIEQRQDGFVDPIGVEIVHAAPRETRLTSLDREFVADALPGQYGKAGRVGRGADGPAPPTRNGRHSWSDGRCYSHCEEGISMRLHPLVDLATTYSPAS